MINENGVTVGGVDLDDDLDMIQADLDADGEFEEFITDTSVAFATQTTKQTFFFNDLIYAPHLDHFYRVMRCSPIYKDEEALVIDHFEYGCLGCLDGTTEVILEPHQMILMNKTVNEAVQLYFLRELQIAQDANVGGEFSCTVKAYGSMNSKEVKITAEASLGNWDNRGEHKSPELHRSVAYAIHRYWENKHDEPKLITVR